jgi:hypothetical protein
MCGRFSPRRKPDYYASFRNARAYTGAAAVAIEVAKEFEAAEKANPWNNFLTYSKRR